MAWRSSSVRRSVLVRDNNHQPAQEETVGQMEALEVLKGEHSALLSELYMIDRQLIFLESSGPIRGARVLGEMFETSLKMSTDLRHHTSKEEKGLFAILETRLGTDRDLVGIMKREHEELIERVTSLTTELERMTTQHDTKKTWNLVTKIQDLKGELANHLSREERILFWLAELRLSRVDQRKIASSIGDEVVGNRSHT